MWDIDEDLIVWQRKKSTCPTVTYGVQHVLICWSRCFLLTDFKWGIKYWWQWQSPCRTENAISNKIHLAQGTARAVVQYQSSEMLHALPFWERGKTAILFNSLLRRKSKGWTVKLDCRIKMRSSVFSVSAWEENCDLLKKVWLYPLCKEVSSWSTRGMEWECPACTR